MINKYKKAFKEIYIILNKSSQEEVNKIPEHFINFIKENMDEDYEPIIYFDENFENTVLEETLLILALVYRDYLATEEERNELIRNEEIQIKEIYDIENIFKQRKDKNEENSVNIEQHLVVIKDKKWYEKILEKILNLFRK